MMPVLKQITVGSVQNFYVSHPRQQWQMPTSIRKGKLLKNPSQKRQKIHFKHSTVFQILGLHLNYVQNNAGYLICHYIPSQNAEDGTATNDGLTFDSTVFTIGSNFFHLLY